MKATHLVKLERVINSCETFEQLGIARRYAQLMAKRFNAAKEVGSFAGQHITRRAFAIDPLRAQEELWRTYEYIDP